jgi:hypothetical protein
MGLGAGDAAGAAQEHVLQQRRGTWLVVVYRNFPRSRFTFELAENSDLRKQRPRARAQVFSKIRLDYFPDLGLSSEDSLAKAFQRTLPQSADAMRKIRGSGEKSARN